VYLVICNATPPYASSHPCIASCGLTAAVRAQLVWVVGCVCAACVCACFIEMMRPQRPLTCLQHILICSPQLTLFYVMPHTHMHDVDCQRPPAPSLYYLVSM
jgi:hypothetical protein